MDSGLCPENWTHLNLQRRLWRGQCRGRCPSCIELFCRFAMRGVNTNIGPSLEGKAGIEDHQTQHTSERAPECLAGARSLEAGRGASGLFDFEKASQIIGCGRIRSMVCRLTSTESGVDPPRTPLVRPSLNTDVASAATNESCRARRNSCQSMSSLDRSKMDGLTSFVKRVRETGRPQATCRPPFFWSCPFPLARLCWRRVAPLWFLKCIIIKQL